MASPVRTSAPALACSRFSSRGSDRVSGVGLVVYTAVHCGLPLSIAGLPATPPGLNALQIGAAVVLTVTFALSMHTPPRELLAAAIGGGLIWVLYTLLREAAFSPIIAAGVSAAAIGTIAHFAASWARRPALPYVVPLIGPLLPGTALYRGLLELGGGNVSQGLLHLTQALAIGMALAAGICVGGELVRAFRGTPIAAVASNWRRPAARRRPRILIASPAFDHKPNRCHIVRT